MWGKRGFGAVLAGTVLASGAVVGVSGPAVAAPEFVACPATQPSPVPSRPPKPSPPALPPEQAVIGGEGLATAGLTVPAGAPTPPSLTASSWIVADLDTGQVLGACGPHEYATPASVQKMLLAATMMPKLDPKQVVMVTRQDLAIEPGSSAVGLLLGGKYTVETLWMGLLFDSGNDAANALARTGGGSGGQAAGVAAMNAEARRLGALQTHAVTPSGLDGPGQFTSAYDLALIARACFARADFRKYVATKTAKIPAQPPKDPRGFQIQNDNALLKTYPGALGGKSGFTTLARHSFVGAAKRGDRTLVAAVLGAEARPLRASAQTAKLLDWGFALPAEATVGRLVDPGEVDPTPAPAEPRAGQDAPAGASASTGVPGSSPTAAVGLAVAVAAVLLVLLVMVTRRRAVVRARRAALERRRALRDPTAPLVARDGGRPLRTDGARAPRRADPRSPGHRDASRSPGRPWDRPPPAGRRDAPPPDGYRGGSRYRDDRP
ncbi:hypothetical protein Prum_083110 [Phytohabitans rumicis]|uniref:Peptidase S11 D-alanyl-D-alanine carboxypeptidase A N-terminal domain-containing protein n=1 Tax=Phytohabitans rumicis TaxID=1076125 RepID=A0A6V8LJ56_9ACTN|nr:serine hydrolase [Phytohabitans rumicis]GFJ94669.1 hypothetical protein Prum_083110 [Phytohabitans rumicis]